MYPHVGVDASGLATLRATVLDHLRGFVPTAYAVPAFAAPAPAASGPIGPCYALANGGAAVGRRGSRNSTAASTTARRPTADSDSARMMELVERAQAGEAEAFGRLYDQYSDTVYRYIYYRVGGKATAEDLTSETFLRALRRISTFTWQGRDFGAWLVTIARNLVADHFKSSRFRLEVTTGEMLDANEVGPQPGGLRPGVPLQRGVARSRTQTQPPATGVRHPALPARALGRRNSPGHGQERRSDQNLAVPGGPHTGPAAPGGRPLRPARLRAADRPAAHHSPRPSRDAPATYHWAPPVPPFPPRRSATPSVATPTHSR